MSLEAINAERRARMTLERRLGELESRVRGMWVFPATVSTPPYTQLLIGSGNTLATIDSVVFKGVKRAASLASVPTLVPTGINTSYSDGLSACYDYGTSPEATGGPLAWVSAAGSLTVKNPAGGSDITVTNLPSIQMIQGTLALSLSSYLVPCAAGGYARVYVPSIVTI